MPAARDLTPLPPILTDADWNLDFEFYAATEDDPLDMEGQAFSIAFAPMRQPKPAAADVHELTSAGGKINVEGNIVAIGVTWQDLASWTPGLYSVELRRVNGDAREVLYLGSVQVGRGLSQVAELGGGGPLPAPAPVAVRLFSEAERVRVLRGEAAGGAASAAASAAAAALSEGAAATSAAAALADRLLADAAAEATAADRLQTGQDAGATAADRAAVAADAAATHADRLQADADATATAADRVQTGQDAGATAADRAAVAADAAAAHADRLQADADALATAADRVQTGLDRAATAGDRVQTGLDRAAASQSATNAQGYAASVNFGGQVDAAALKLDLFGIVAGLAKALSVGPDGAIYLGKAEALRVLADLMQAGELQVLAKTMASGGKILAPSAGSQGGRQLLLEDLAGQLALSVHDDGTIAARKAAIDVLTADVASAGALRLLSAAGSIVATLANLGSAAAAGVADGNGAAALQIDMGGSVEMKFDGALPWVGSKAATGGNYLVLARVRRGSANGLHDLYSVNLTTGAEVQLTSDAADQTDFLNPAIFGNWCVYTKRKGFRTQRRAVPITGGAEQVLMPEKSLHMLGDSFVSNELLAAIVGALDDPNRATTSDGLGGSWLMEQYYRFHGGTVPAGATPSAGVTYAGTPQFYDRTLIIMDGGLSDPDPVTQVGNIASCLTPVLKRWIYVQAGYDSSWTPTQVANRQAVDAAIQAAFPNNYCETYNYMRAHATGSTVGSAGGQVWPADAYGDTLHPSPYGKAVLGQCIGACLNSKGW